jgi:hypothetical protein
MDLEHALAQLRKERDLIEAAIRCLESLDRAGGGPTSNPANGANGSYRNLPPGEE